MNTQKTFSLKHTILVAGSYLSFVIGSGFATGQENMQYFASCGAAGFLGILFCFIVNLIMNTEFTVNGYNMQFDNNKHMYTYYAGKYLGVAYDYFAQFVCFLSFVIMCAGAGATMNTYFHTPTWVGTTLVAALAAATAVLGLQKITTIIGSIGPFLIIYTVVVCASSLLPGVATMSITDGIKLAGEMNLLGISGNWFISAINYMGLGVLWNVTFLPLLGRGMNSRKEGFIGIPIGVFAFFFCVAIMVAAFFCNMDIVGGAEVPVLMLASNLHPAVAALLAIIILLGIYSTSVPLLYSPVVRFVDEKTAKGKFIIVIVAVIGWMITLFIPYSKVLNIAFSIGGWGGIALVVLVLLKIVSRLLNKKEASSEE